MTREQPGSPDERKLDALIAIGKAVADLGSNLTAMISHTLENSRKLDAIDRKLDKVLGLAVGQESPKKS